MDSSLRHLHHASRPHDATAPTGSATPMSTEDKATASYVRRTLCAHHAVAVGTPPSVHELLPPLTSSNEVDLQLYAVIAVILKEFVQAWYNKITPDHAFIDEVLLVIAHVTRGLEERVRRTNLQALLIDEIPRLLEQHISACRLAQQQAQSQHLKPKPAAIYHALHPHPALEPVPNFSELETLVEQERNERAWRHMLVQGVLAIVLPTEDVQNGCLQSLVEEVIAEMIIGNVVSTRLCQPWALWELATNVIRSSRPTVVQAGSEGSRTKSVNTSIPSGTTDSRNSPSRLAKFGLLSGAQGVEDENTTKHLSRSSYHSIKSSTMHIVWTSISAVFLVVQAVRWLLLTLFSLSKYPSRATQTTRIRPMVDMNAWSALSLLIELPVRMPWLLGFMSLVHLTGRRNAGQLAGADGTLDRFLSHTIHSNVLNPAHIPTILRSLRRTFFPSNTFPRTTKSPPDAAAIAAIKQECIQTILDAIPSLVRNTYFATTDYAGQAAVVERWLDVFGDAYMNKHVVFALLELCVVRLIPELTIEGPKVLLAQRMGPES